MTEELPVSENDIRVATAQLRSILLDLKPAGPKGFEGLAREVVGALTGLEYRLKRSGQQDAVDAVAVKEGRRYVLEAKRYIKSAGLERHMMATLAYSASAVPRPDLVVFTATVEIDADVSRRVRGYAEQNAIEVVTLDWSGELPSLAVVLAADPQLLPNFLGRNKRHAAAKRAREAIQSLRSSALYPEAQRFVLAELTAAVAVFDTVLADSLHQHETAMSDRVRALQLYGQALCPLQPHVDHIITRESVLKELDEAATAIAPVRSADLSKTFVTPAPLLIMGDEGVGKTWLVAQWWLTRYRNCLFVFIPSQRFRGVETDPESVLFDCLQALLDPSRTATSEGKQSWTRRLRSDSFQRAARGRMVIVLDGLNEAPDTDWRAVLDVIWRYTHRVGGRLLFTTRPAFWRRRESEMVGTDWSDLTTVHVQGFSPAEVAQVCALAGRNYEAIAPALLERLNNPRVLYLALRLFSTLRREADLGVEQLLFAYWGQRQADRPDLARLDRDHDVFLRGLARHAEEFHRRRLDAARRGQQDLDSADVGFDVDDLRERFRGLERYSRLESAGASTLIGEIREGRFFEEDPLVPASGYVFRKDSLASALGLYLVHDLMDLVQTERSRVTLSGLHERLAALLEPVLDFDQTADQLMAAVVIACRDPAVRNEVQSALLEHLLALRNRPQQLKHSLSALAVEVPEVFCRVAERALYSKNAEQLDSWLIAALRYMVSAGVGLEFIRSLLVVQTEDEARLYPRACRVVYNHHLVENCEKLAAIILIGQHLAPVAGILHDWARVSSSRARSDNDLFNSDLFNTPVGLLLRFNDADPEVLTSGLRALQGGGPEYSQELDPWAVAALMSLIGSPEALEIAETRHPKVTLLYPVYDAYMPPWLRVFDPHAALVELREDLHERRVDMEWAIPYPALSEGEAHFALAARTDADRYVGMVHAAVQALVRDAQEEKERRKTAESFIRLVYTATSALAVGQRLTRFDPQALFAIANVDWSFEELHRPQDPEHLRETLLAIAPESQYPNILFAKTHVKSSVPARSTEARSARQLYWSPPLPEALSTEIVSECLAVLSATGSCLSAERFELLEALGEFASQEPPGDIGPDLLKCILEPDPKTGAIRHALFSLATKINSAGLGVALVRSGWTYKDDPDLPLARSISALVATQLAGRIPLEQLSAVICESDLPAAAEAVTEAELPVLSQMIEEVVRRDRGRNVRAPTPTGAARIIAAGTPWMAEHVQWLRRAAGMMLEGTHPEIDDLTAALLAAGGNPVSGAADYLLKLLQLSPVASERRSARVLAPALAVANNEPTRRRELLDGLVLRILEDRTLADLAQAARELGPPIVTMMRVYTDSLFSSGRTVRMAYGLMLDMLLSDAEGPRLSTGCPKETYLVHVEEHVRRVQQARSQACYWAHKRWVEKDVGSEYLALSCDAIPLPWIVPEFGHSQPVDNLDALFLFRFRQRCEQWGRGTLFGQPAPPRWLSVRRPEF